MIQYDRHELYGAATSAGLGAVVGFLTYVTEPPAIGLAFGIAGTALFFIDAALRVVHIGRFNGWWSLRP